MNLHIVAHNVVGYMCVWGGVKLHWSGLKKKKGQECLKMASQSPNLNPTETSTTYA